MAKIQEAEFLPLILARPDDDTPRLMYADALSESDDPSDLARGEFIRIQLVLARLSENHPRYNELYARQTQLLNDHYKEWAAPLKKIVRGVEFHRGLIDRVSISVRSFLTSAWKLFRFAPIRRIRFLQIPDRIEQLADSEWLRTVEELDFSASNQPIDSLMPLFSSPQLTALRALDLSFNGLNAGTVIALAQSRLGPLLEDLKLNDNVGLGNGFVEALTRHCPRLVRLDLSATSINASAMELLLTLPALESLQFANNPIGDAGLKAWLNSRVFETTAQRDRMLDLSKTRMTTEFLDALCRSPFLSSVITLRLNKNSLGNDGAALLARSPNLQQLSRLNLSWIGITREGGESLVSSSWIGQLDVLDVSHNFLPPDTIDALRKAMRTAQGLIHGEAMLFDHLEPGQVGIERARLE